MDPTERRLEGQPASEPSSPPSETRIIQDIESASGTVIGAIHGSVTIQQPGRPPVRLALPSRPPHFRGRDTELAELLPRLKPGRIFTITAPGGMGKTALAAQAIWLLTAEGTAPPAEFPGGVFFHTFYNQPSAELALQELAAFFWEDPKPTPAAAAQRALAERITLLVLDGAEAADDLTVLRELCGRCGLLITTRDREQIFGDNLDLRPLDASESLALLKDWGGAQIDDDDQAARLCELVGRLPLAIRLAGRYMASRKEPVSEYAAWLEATPLVALDRGKRRDESIPLLFRRSLEGLDDDAMDVLDVTSLLAFAPFDRGLIAAGLGVEPESVSEPLGELVRFGLLNREKGRYQTAHALLQTYAREEFPADEDILFNLVDYFTQLAGEQTERGPEGFVVLDAALPHIRAVLDHLQSAADWELLLVLSEAIQEYLDLHGRSVERQQVCQMALQVAQANKDTEAESRFLTWLGNAYSDLGEPQRAIELHQRALRIDRKIGDRSGEGTDLIDLGNCYAALDDLSRAIRYYKKALQIATEINDRDVESTALTGLGNAYHTRGKPKQVIQYQEQVLQIARDTSNRRSEAIALMSLGNAYLNLDEIPRAIEYYEMALEIDRDIGDRRGKATDFYNLGVAYLEMGKTREERVNYGRAREYYRQALDIYEDILPAGHPDILDARKQLDDLPPE
jgi:tetratricopeptide (TPR) repeat protein